MKSKRKTKQKPRSPEARGYDAVEAARRTLEAIDWKKFWAKVLKRIAPLVEANERVRAKSLEHGWKTVR